MRHPNPQLAKLVITHRLHLLSLRDCIAMPQRTCQPTRDGDEKGVKFKSLASNEQVRLRCMLCSKACIPEWVVQLALSRRRARMSSSLELVAAFCPRPGCLALPLPVPPPCFAGFASTSCAVCALHCTAD